MNKRAIAEGVERRARIMDFFVTYANERGESPTVAQIGTAVGLASKSSTFQHLCQLVQEGKLRRGRRGYLLP